MRRSYSSSFNDVKILIDSGIGRLWSMQTTSGGLGYWPGAAWPNLWGTTYAAGFLAEAARKGHTLDSFFVEELTAYLTSTLRHNDDMNVNTRAQICRVLATFDKPQRGRMERLTERASELDMAGRAHLAVAWLRIGRKDRARSILSDDLLSHAVIPSTGGRLTSQVRQEAVLLDALLEIAPDHPSVVVLVHRLEKARSNGSWGNTLENATALAALSRYQSAATDDAAFSGTVRIDGRDVATFTHETPATVSVPNATKPFEIDSTGQGDIYIAVTTHGLRRQALSETYDRQIKVRRRWLDRKGEEIDPAALRVGDLVHVEVTIGPAAKEDYRFIENVAIVDALPGGLEVENPRLATSAAFDDSNESARADHVEFLDDRVVVFGTVAPEPSVYRYTLRVITPGEFAVPPIEASCMYDAGVASIHGKGEVSIQP